MVAKLLSNRIPDPMTAQIATDFAEVFRFDNPRFDQEKFLETIVKEGGIDV